MKMCQFLIGNVQLTQMEEINNGSENERVNSLQVMYNDIQMAGKKKKTVCRVNSLQVMYNTIKTPTHRRKQNEKII